MIICLALCLFQWQQRVSYKIEARLNTEEQSLKAVEYLTYYNKSPHSLETLYVHLYANAYKDENTVYAQESKRMRDYYFIDAKDSERGYIDIENIYHNNDSLQFEINETIMSIPLNQLLKSGDSITLKIESYLKIPKQFSRLGFQPDHYEMVQWYPKICVFDEDGWHLDTYHAIGEFYGEFACFDVEINLPGDYVVAATGERVDSLDKEFLDSLIINKKKIEVDERRTVRFFAENVHDFAWVCDPDFLVKKYEVDSIDIFVFYLKHNEKNWNNAGVYAVDAVKRYNEWYGMYPYKTLSIVNGYNPAGDGMEYPTLIIIRLSENWYTRFFEMVIIHEIGHQWFYGVLGSNELEETWLDEGFTTYTEIRYFEDKYGKENSLIKLPLVPSLPSRYYYKFTYYITQTNYIEKPVLTPAYEFIDTPIAYMNSSYSKPALFLFNLEGVLGKEKFDIILKRYFHEYKFTHPKTRDFIRICEEESEQDLKQIFDGFLNSTEFCDWRIKQVKKNKVQIENAGNIQMPVDVFLEGDSETEIIRIDGKAKIETISLSESEKIKKVVIDPYGYSLEPNYWNNYYPRKIEIKPILSLPSFDSYQILFLPYLWYGNYDGITTGLYLFGSEFIDYDFVKGRHQWTGGCVYGTKSKNFYPAFSYQTPIIFKKGMRTRIAFAGSNSNREDKLRFAFINNFDTPFSLTPQIELKHTFAYYYLKSYDPVDSIDWDLGRHIVFTNHFNFKYQNWEVNADLHLSNKIIGSDRNYARATLEIKKEIEAFIPFNIRFFAGRVFGDAPTQDKLFLSGALRISMLADLVFGQAGYWSPQEHLHIPGDGNMRGYQTRHIKSDQMYCVNLEFPDNSPIRIFSDFGYYDDYAFDVGARLVIGPLSFNLPFYTLSDDPWKMCWSIGF